MDGFFAGLEDGDDEVHVAIAVEVRGDDGAGVALLGEAEEEGEVGELVGRLLDEGDVMLVAVPGGLVVDEGFELFGEVGVPFLAVFFTEGGVDVVSPEGGAVVIGGFSADVAVGDVEVTEAVVVEIGGGGSPGPAGFGEVVRPSGFGEGEGGVVF